MMKAPSAGWIGERGRRLVMRTTRLVIVPPEDDRTAEGAFESLAGTGRCWLSTKSRDSPAPRRSKTSDPSPVHLRGESLRNLVAM